MQLVEHKKASRLSRDPIPDDASENGVVTWRRLRETDLDIIELSHAHYLNVLHAAAYTGLTVAWLQKRTKVLKRAPNLYIELCHQQRDNPEKYLRNQRQLFRSCPNGEVALDRRKRTLPYQFPNSSSLEHDVLVDEGILSFKIGLKRHPEVVGITPHDIINRDKVSPATRQNKDWHYFPITATHTPYKSAHPDFFPLGVQRPFDEPKQHPFFVTEFETGSNNKNASDLRKSPTAVRSKVLSWLDVIYENHDKHSPAYKPDPTYWTHLGLPNLYIMFLHTTEGDAASTLKIIEENVPPAFQCFFLVKVQEDGWTEKIKDPTTREIIVEQRLPTGWFLETDFMRAGKLPPFNLLTSRLD